MLSAVIIFASSDHVYENRELGFSFKIPDDIVYYKINASYDEHAKYARNYNEKYAFGIQFWKLEQVDERTKTAVSELKSAEYPKDYMKMYFPYRNVTFNNKIIGFSMFQLYDFAGAMHVIADNIYGCFFYNNDFIINIELFYNDPNFKIPQKYSKYYRFNPKVTNYDNERDGIWERLGVPIPQEAYGNMQANVDTRIDPLYQIVLKESPNAPPEYVRLKKILDEIIDTLTVY
jgi:hypothetical protein